MPESKIIPTLTTLTVTGNTISIKSEYFEDSLPDTLAARIASVPGIQDGVSYIEGDGLIQMKNSPEHLTYYLDNNGNLILSINTGDQDNYSIDSNGNLVYTTIE